jgi:anti-sigma B factor antagonist
MTDVSTTDEPGHRELLRVWSEPIPDGVVLRVAGEVDLVSAPTFSAELAALRELAAPGRLVLDLTGVAFMASAGLSVLIDEDQHCRDAGVDLRVVSGNRTIARTLRMTGLTETLNVFDTLAEAVSGTP